MPRRRVVAKREILPDPKYHNQTLAKFINHVMVSGKKAVAEKIVYGALDHIEAREHNDPVEIFEKALESVAPLWKSNRDASEVLRIKFRSKCGLLVVRRWLCVGSSIVLEVAARNRCQRVSLES